MKVYEQQLRKLSNPVNKKDKDDILQSEAKLQQLGYVDYIKNLPPDVQKYLAEHQTQNFIPWRAVWKGNSVSTPCRIVFDASQATSSGYSLNDILAKGKNNLNLVAICIADNTSLSRQALLCCTFYECLNVQQPYESSI